MLKQVIKDKIKEHALREFPNEACGILLNKGKKLVECKNISLEPENSFVINYKELAEAKELGDFFAVYHSHPRKSDGSFSAQDIYVSERMEIDSVLYMVEQDKFEVYKPEGIKIPYVGRPFSPGVFDCITLVQDYFKEEHGVIFERDYEHELRDYYGDSEDWLLRAKYYEQFDYAYSHFENYFKENGFIKVEWDEMKKSDLILERTPQIRFATHCEIYLGKNITLTQTWGVSEYDYLRKADKKFHTSILRHKSLI